MYQRILVPIDGSATSNRGVDEAIRLARLTGGQLRLIHIIDTLSMAISGDGFVGWTAEMFEGIRAAGAQILDEARAKAVAAGVAVDTILYDKLEGPVHELVISEALSWKADLIVLGTHGRRGVGRMFLGSSAEYIVRVAPVPVLLVRAPELRVPEQPSEGEVLPCKVTLPSAALAFE